MFQSKVLKVVPVMALLLSGTAAQALTADQVWADWQALAMGAGVKISAATEVKGDGELTLNGVTLAPQGGKGGATISEVMLVEEDDGSVTIYPEDIKVEVSPPEGRTGKLDIVHEGLGLSVHEDEGGLGYGAFADSLSVMVQASGPNTNLDLKVNLTALDGRYTREKLGMLLGIAAERLTYDIANKDSSVDSKQTSDTTGLDLTAELTVPEGLDLMSLQGPADFFAAARNGLGLLVEVKQGSSDGTVEDASPFMPLNMRFTSGPAVTGIEMSKDAFAVDTQVTTVAATLLPPMVPAEIPVSMDEMMIGFGMPVVTAEPGDYGLAMKLGNLVIGEGAWAMVDPGATLARDPINLDVDVSGKVKVDLIDLMESSENGTQPKSLPELMTLDVTTLGLSLAGAALSGSGAFTFDNSLVAAGGPPMPLGSADLRLEGGNKLIDGLIAIGILSEQDAMGARMMMAMFGKPEGEDVLTSKVEAKEGGAIFVNGQRIQ
ncbi:MAG: hypothetical protein K9G71_12015 [Rhodobacteraceae bacterium]|nr:hypothetical protein [Paracoccaceae bacterium]MCF8515079.1 hypothetical protein [Paracoccaceae bacterium]